MSETRYLHYFWNCGLLIIPILVWNAVFARFLPPAFAAKEFWRDIPAFVALGENCFRVAVMALPFLMPLEISTVAQQRHLLLFAAGVLLYFLSWIPQLALPQSRWSRSWPGFLAPACTPIVWLAGLGLLGRRLYWASPYQPWMYIGLSCVFIAFHAVHAGIVYSRNCRRSTD